MRLMTAMSIAPMILEVPKPLPLGIEMARSEPTLR